MKNLTELLFEFRTSNSSFDGIYSYFEKYLNSLLTKYKIDLYSTDLILHLWNISLELDLSNFESSLDLKKYIYTSLRRYAINLYHKNIRDFSKVTYNSLIVDVELDKSSNINSLDVSDLIFNDLLINLSSKQKEIISLRYKYCLSDLEISNFLNISRQAVHKTREKALSSLRNKLN